MELLFVSSVLKGKGMEVSSETIAVDGGCMVGKGQEGNETPLCSP